MERQFFSGNTLEQAVLAAARHHGLDPDRVAYKMRDKKHGFLNIRRRVVIEVDPAAPEQTDEMRAERAQFDAEEAQEREPSSTSDSPGPSLDSGHRTVRHSEGRRDQGSWRGEEVSWTGGEQAGDNTEAITSAVEELGGLGGIKLASSIQRADKGFDIEVSGVDSELLLANQGSGLDAVEHLLPRLVRGLTGYGVPCRVDCEGFRTVREEELRQLALDTAEEVRREREPRHLEPMNPADRRQVHMALVDDPDVRTESEGEGFLKRVRVVPL